MIPLLILALLAAALAWVVWPLLEAFPSGDQPVPVTSSGLTEREREDEAEDRLRGRAEEIPLNGDSAERR